MSDSEKPAQSKIESSNPIELVDFLKQEYARADDFCKEVSTFRDQAGIPPINELRYAGHHLLISITSRGVIENLEEVRRAIRHAQRAAYEAAEAGIQIAIREIDLFRKDYRRVTVGDVVRDWQEILGRRNTIERHLNVPRATGDNRDLDHERHIASFRELSAIVSRLDIARDDLNKKMTGDRRLELRFRVASGLAVISIIIAIVVALTR